MDVNGVFLTGCSSFKLQLLKALNSRSQEIYTRNNNYNKFRTFIFYYSKNPASAISL
ncbi:hypothetical protein RND71_009572 [Anisodus tanguticus]|uniref:Uncharacterized protein n=1 Tax=Anisodus tanguticus TaxID=243964 RepID=A0AAE1SIJ8_9SOLA|nr:hypothetical protein RND71_009572 [Anisodus tanguticus]